MVVLTINKKLLELGPSLGFLYKKKRVTGESVHESCCLANRFKILISIFRFITFYFYKKPVYKKPESQI